MAFHSPPTSAGIRASTAHVATSVRLNFRTPFSPTDSSSARRMQRGRPHGAPHSTADEIRLHLQRQYAFGPDRFRDAIEAQLGRRAGPAKIGRPTKKMSASGAEESVL